MKPVWAHKETICAWSGCKEVIEPESERLDDMIRRGEGMRRLHYHVACYFKYVTEYFKKNPYMPVRGSGGRPVLELSEEDRGLRRKVLGRLHSLRQYYIPLLAPEFGKPVDQLGDRTLTRFKNFHGKRNELIMQLEELGGVPENYQDAQTPTLGTIDAPSEAINPV